MDERLKQLRDAMVFFSAERMATKEELASLEKRMDQSDLWTRVVFGTLFTTMAATLLKLFLGQPPPAISYPPLTKTLING